MVKEALFSDDPYSLRNCMTPTAELRKIERGRSGRADPLSYYAPNQAIPAENPIRSPPLAAARPLIILSWPEALNARGSRCACRMAISRNACSLPDFPEFAQAVRYGVPGTPSARRDEAYRLPRGATARALWALRFVG